MFDITSSKLLILAVVALLVIGPKDLPALLRTLGKYMGIIKKHANDFRAQFDEAMRESELAEIKKQVETVGQETEATMRAAEATVEKQLADARGGVEGSMGGDPFAPPPPPVIADPLPVAHEDHSILNGAAHAADAPGAESTPQSEAGPALVQHPEPGRASEKSGA
jgi:sec-independent protein translocase protein TatB